MWRVLSSKSVFPCRITIIPLPFITRYVNKLSGCLVCVFKQSLSVFKQYFTHFNILFYPYIFSQIFLNNNFQFLNTYTKQTLYHKLWTSYTTNCIVLCVTIITLFAFIFFLIHVLLFFSVLSIFFFRNFSPVTLLQFIALDWLLNRVNTQYSLLSFTWGWLSLNYKFIWIQ